MKAVYYKKEEIEKNGLSLSEFLAALSILEGVNINEGLNSLKEKGFIMNFQGKTFMVDHLKKRIEQIILDSQEDKIPNKELDDLVIKLRELFPSGKKDGTTYYWRGNTNEIKHKLKIFFKRYGNFDDEIIIDATKRYVDSFAGQYRFMHLLKYFIIKNVKDAAGDINEQSELFAFIENANQRDHNVDLQSNII